MSITSRWEDITPAMAAKYLEGMNGNRTVRQPRVDHYAAQMKAGLWRETHQGIAFDEDGVLVDGQHRMWAIIESGCTVRIYVSRGLSAEAVTALDGGLARGYADIAHYTGWNTDPLTASLAKVMVLGINNRNKLVPAEILQRWYLHYQDGIDFALKLRTSTRPYTGKSMTTAMATAFARAFYTVPAETLQRFGEVLRTGQYEVEADRAAFVLRDAWLGKRLGTAEGEQYDKTAAAIRAFVERRAIKHLQRPASELFTIRPLPKELRYTPQTTKRRPPLKVVKKEAA